MSFVFTTERYSQSVIVKCGESDGRLRDCLTSPVFQWGPRTGSNCQKNNDTEALEQLYDERYGLYTTETSSSLCFLPKTAWVLSLEILTNKDSNDCIVVLY